MSHDEYRAQLDMFTCIPQHFMDKRVLEVGCGPRGGVLSTMATLPGQFTGVDSLAMVYTLNGIKKIPHGMTMIQHDMCEVNQLWENYFDAVFCINTIDHGEDEDTPPQAMTAMTDALRTEGVLYLHCHCRTPEQLDTKHTYSVTPDLIMELGEANGLFIDSFSIYDKDPINRVNDRPYSTLVARMVKKP
jgi:2-polyprenyl-3-methyl-5-hydroxy-6-metoxy-1,4-benzoquinol methylase